MTKVKNDYFCYMGRHEKKRVYTKQSDLVPCQYCGKEYRSRGLHMHIRLVHKDAIQMGLDKLMGYTRDNVSVECNAEGFDEQMDTNKKDEYDNPVKYSYKELLELFRDLARFFINHAGASPGANVFHFFDCRVKAQKKVLAFEKKYNYSISKNDINYLKDIYPEFKDGLSSVWKEYFRICKVNAQSLYNTLLIQD